MTILQPHSPPPSNAAPNSATQNCATRHSFVPRCERADAAHIITLLLKIFAVVVNEELWNGKSIIMPLLSLFPAPAADGAQSRAWRSNLFSHHHVGIAKRHYTLESRFFEHRHSSMSRHIPERLAFPIRDRVSLRYSPALSFYGFESGRQRSACDAPPPRFSAHHKTSDAPEFFSLYFWGRETIRTHIVDSRQFFARSVLTLPHRLGVRIHQDSMRAAFVDEFFLLLAIPGGSQFSG